MKKEFNFKNIILIILFFVEIVITIQGHAQKEITLGSHINKSKGDNNTTVVKGQGIGVKIDAGKKIIKLQKLTMNLLDSHPDSVKFYVRLFPIKNNILASNIMPDSIYSINLKDHQISLDISGLNISVSGDFVIGLEWAESASEAKNRISFPSSLFKSGFYYKTKNYSQWKWVRHYGLDLILKGVVETQYKKDMLKEYEKELSKN